MLYLVCYESITATEEQIVAVCNSRVRSKINIIIKDKDTEHCNKDKVTLLLLLFSILTPHHLCLSFQSVSYRKYRESFLNVTQC